MKSNYKRLGDYIRQVDVRNRDERVKRLLGVSIDKVFIESIANTVGTDMSVYKIVKRGQFAYGPVTSRNGDKVSIALLTEEECIISSSYTVFEITDAKNLLPKYLNLWFKRPEFDRYARFHSHGSAREIFDWEEMCNVELPVPPIEEQQKIVDAYQTIEHRIALKKKINENLEAIAFALFRELQHEESMQLNEFVSFQEGPGIRNWQFTSNGTPFINIRCIQDGDIDLSKANNISNEEANNKYSHFMLKEWDVVVSTSGTIGKNAIIRKEHLPLCLNTSIIRFTPKMDFNDFSYMLYLIRSKDFIDFICSEATGSAQVNLGPTQLNKMSIKIATNEERRIFHNRIFPLIVRQEENKKEILKLKVLKSVLLSNMAK